MIDGTLKFDLAIVKMRTHKNINLNGYKAVVSAVYSAIDTLQIKQVGIYFQNYIKQFLKDLFNRFYDIALDRLQINTWEAVGFILEDIYSFGAITLTDDDFKYISQHFIGNKKKIYEEV